MEHSLTVAYVGSKTSNFDNSIPQFNNPDPIAEHRLNAAGRTRLILVTARATCPRLGNIRYLDSFGNGNYHGLQTSFEKRYSNGLTLGLAYTYSKSLGEGYGRNEGPANLGWISGPSGPPGRPNSLRL